MPIRTSDAKAECDVHGTPTAARVQELKDGRVGAIYKLVALHRRAQSKRPELWPGANDEARAAYPQQRAAPPRHEQIYMPAAKQANMHAVDYPEIDYDAWFDEEVAGLASMSMTMQR